MDGFEVCQAIREFSDMPIVMLTAKGDDMDKILGLDYGADDYITKPFNILEVKRYQSDHASYRIIERKERSFFDCGERGSASDQTADGCLFQAGSKPTAKEFDLLNFL